MTSRRYRAKPVQIEAMQYTPGSETAIEKWSNREVAVQKVLNRSPEGPAIVYALSVKTLEGDMVANPGDYIVKGTHGEFYPVKPKIFESKYEEVE